MQLRSGGCGFGYVEFMELSSNFCKAYATYERYAVVQFSILLYLLRLLKCDFGSSGLDSGSLLLDLGCGDGKLSRNFRDCRVMQVDLAYGMCKGAASGCGSGLVINADMHSLPFCDASFDCIVASMVLQWSACLRQALSEAVRVLKRGRCLYASVPVLGTFCELVSVANDVGIKAVDTARCVPVFQLEECITAAGFSIQSLSCEGYVEYYHGLADFLLSLKRTGAYSGRMRLGTGVFDLVSRYNKRFMTGGMVPVSWKIAYVVAVKD